MDFKYLIKEANYYRKLDGMGRALKKFLLTQTFLGGTVNAPIYNEVYKRRIAKRIAKIEPRILQIENTNLCNAKCVMCPHKIMKRKGKIMKQKDFEKIVENVLKDYKIKTLTITGFGEPFADSGLMEKIKYVNEKYPKLKIEIYTNASLLNMETVERLLKTRVNKINFSINGTEKNYKKIMGLDYANTKKNVEYFLKRKKELELNFPLTNISLMVLKENEEDIKKFVRVWRKLADSVRVYAPSNWAGTLKGIIQKTPFKNKRWPCFALWNNITVDVDGNVIMCCRDYESKVKFGNLLEKNIKEIREDKKYKELLERQMKLDFKTPICSSCDNSFDSSLDWIC